MSSSFAVTSTGVDVPAEVTAALSDDAVAVRLVRTDATLWGPDAESGLEQLRAALSA